MGQIFNIFLSNVKKTPRLWGRFTKKNKLTQWGSHILTSILTSHMMVTKNPQNVHRNYFWAILLTFIFDIKIDVNICEPYYVHLFFLWTSSIVCMFDFLIFDIFLTTWHLFDILTHQLNLNHLSPHRAIFSNFFPFLYKMFPPQQKVIQIQPKFEIFEPKYIVWDSKQLTYYYVYLSFSPANYPFH